jgi:hypothetical protein
MVTEGVGHRVSGRGIVVARAQIETIEKPTYPKDIKCIRSFLGDTCFYRKFIKDFSKISKYPTNLLQKYVPFFFNDDCVDFRVI